MDTLNLSYNQVKKIENLDCIKTLHTLNLANNYVENLEDFEHLEYLLEVSVLDLSNNHIQDPLIVQTLSRMPGLRVLNLMGNPVIRKIPSYRKTLILACVCVFWSYCVNIKWRMGVVIAGKSSVFR